MITAIIEHNGVTYSAPHPNRQSAIRWVTDMCTALMLASSLITTEIRITFKGTEDDNHND